MWIRKRLSAERLAHTEGAVDLAGRLARRHGVDVSLCEEAAWLHDGLKEESVDDLLAEARRLGLPEELSRPAFVLHAAVMGRLARERFQVSDAVVEAITYHPMGHPALGDVGKVTYLADKLEPGRSYVGVDELRRKAEGDLHEGFRLTLAANVRFLESAGRTPHPLSVMTLAMDQRRSTTD